MRNTQARTIIIDLLTRTKRPVSANEIVDHVARSRPDINKSTVYRFIKTLLESDQLVAISLPGRGAMYELKGENDHHHFTCESCHDVVCLDNSKVEIKRMVPKGYAVSPQQLVLSGRCPSCS